MTYELNIAKANQQPHLDIEDDIKQMGNGVFTCVLRINNGIVADYSMIEYTDARKYLRLKEITLEQLAVTFNP